MFKLRVQQIRDKCLTEQYVLINYLVCQMLLILLAVRKSISINKA